MRIFLFAIGGTGSRVLTSVIMQLAAGVRPRDAQGNPIRNLSVVPIIVDPHEDNDGLHNVVRLLNNYRSIRRSIYGETLDPKDPKNPKEYADGFFSVKIETLKETNPQSVADDRFLFKMQKVSDNTFGKFIDLGSMSDSNRMLAEMLFSDDELATKMREGFYGSPNIGSVALNEFKNSDDFRAFQSAFRSEAGDRLFFIGSIFGGTGAAGLPLFISSIRDLAHIDNNATGSNASATAPIGALVVMPYFSIETVDSSPIDSNQFVIKTKSALRYYENNLNRYVNTMYYIADPDGTLDFNNDPGNISNQSGNKAHIVELAGAWALFDFISTPSESLLTEQDLQGRTVAKNTTFKKFGFASREVSDVTFLDLPKSISSFTALPMMKFNILRNYMKTHYSKNLGLPYSKNYSPKLDASVLTTEIEQFFEAYDKWVREQGQQGATAHNFKFFEAPEGDDYSKMFRGISPRKRIIGGHRSLKVKDLETALNNVAQKYGDNIPTSFRWFLIADKAFAQAINDNLIIQ